ncbi:pentatricopeptide repeat-containing protein [Tanacetum coccineum]
MTTSLSPNAMHGTLVELLMLCLYLQSYQISFLGDEEIGHCVNRRITYILSCQRLFSTMSRVGCLETSVGVHGYIVKTMCDVEDDVYLGTGLVDMYAKCGCLDSALDMFRSMGCKNVMTWTSMVSGFVVHGKAKQALKFFNDMIESGIVPNSVTLTSLLFACSQAGLLEEGLYLFHDMKMKFRIIPLSHHYGCIVDLFWASASLI